MKKLLSCFLLAMVLLPTAATAATTLPPTPIHTLTQTIFFHPPQIAQTDGHSTIAIDNTNTRLSHPGAPSLPAQLLTYTFPLGTIITSISVHLAADQTYQLPTTLDCLASPLTIVDDTTLSAPVMAASLEAYPQQHWTYDLGAGLLGTQHTLYLNVRLYPVQYHQAAQTLSFSPTASVTIQYQDPVSNPASLKGSYDLVIIAPEKFTDALKPLVNHKISHGISTLLVARETICDNANYSQGRDCAEKLKLFIKDCIEQYNISSVLLVGGRKGGILKEKWWMPVRYSHLDDGSDFEASYLSDLYFADIYKYDNQSGKTFEDWDSNGNGIFAEWNSNGKDILDMYPDIAIGRLACKNLHEVKTVVKKIMTYENTTAGADWFKTLIVAGGDSSPWDKWNEGEEENKIAISYLPDFTPVKLWTSDGSLNSTDDVITAARNGSGFLFFDGHGNPSLWATHPHNSTTWIDGLFSSDMIKLRNGDKLPIIVCGSCHNAQFNVSLGNLVKCFLQQPLTYFKHRFYYMDWIPECWAWRSVSVPNGGSIACLAYSGLDWFTEGDGNHDGIPDCVQLYSGYMNCNFFYNYGVGNITTLGQTVAQDITGYLTKFPPMAYKLDCKTCQEFTLLGDPTLMIGGYS